MKIAIIGGGIAGLTQGILLKEDGYQVSIFERFDQPLSKKGHGFLMNKKVLDLMESLPSSQNKVLPKNKINSLSLYSPNGETLLNENLEDWYCLKRVDLIRYLISFYEANEINYSHEFSRFNFDKNGTAISVQFTNDVKVKADIFIGADGSNSAVRQDLFGPSKYTPIEVKEVVGISKYSTKSKSNIFQKVQSKEKGLAFGHIPLAEAESVWFMQYDVQLEKDFPCKTPEQIKEFCLYMLEEFPSEVSTVLENNDFSNSYLWKTRDFDLLPSFHKKNIVLIGDAAHMTLPFTSSGTTDAMLDAVTLAHSLKVKNSLEESFRYYYNERKDELVSKLEQGRKLKKYFLEPDKLQERQFLIPLARGK